MATKDLALRAYKAGERSVRVRGGYRRRRKQFTLPLAVVAGFLPLGMETWQAFKTGSNQGGLGFGAYLAGNSLSYNLTGYNFINKTWDLGLATKGWTPIILGMLVHRFIGRPVNRVLNRARVPLIRL